MRWARECEPKLTGRRRAGPWSSPHRRPGRSPEGRARCTERPLQPDPGSPFCSEHLLWVPCSHFLLQVLTFSSLSSKATWSFCRACRFLRIFSSLFYFCRYSACPDLVGLTCAVTAAPTPGTSFPVHFFPDFCRSCAFLQSCGRGGSGSQQRVCVIDRPACSLEHSQPAGTSSRKFST